VLEVGKNIFYFQVVDVPSTLSAVANAARSKAAEDSHVPIEDAARVML
jgi:hypothetical protein